MSKRSFRQYNDSTDTLLLQKSDDDEWEGIRRAFVTPRGTIGGQLSAISFFVDDVSCQIEPGRVAPLH